MSRIRALPDRLITQIAAGEVVERPASVVKELIENSLDAGAAEVRLSLRAGGRDSIRVRDDGSGMDAEDAVLAFRRHATSKLSRLEDLQAIGTLGFRGEALAAIAAVSEVDLRSAISDGDGFRVRVEGGSEVVAEPIAQPRGTSVEVSSLFYNVPARRKFLKQAASEQRRCLEVVQAYALYHRHIAFFAEHQNGNLIEAPGLTLDDDYGALRARVEQLFDAELAARLVPFGDDPNGDDTVWGMVGDRRTSRGRKSFVFVNGRLLRDRTIMSLFYRAARDEWGSGEFPSLFLFIDLPPEQVDVNVHPQKYEVRFRDGDVNQRLYRTLRQGLAVARGHEQAPRAIVEDLPGAPLAWEGLGRESSEAESWKIQPEKTASVVAEPAAETASPGRIAEATTAAATSEHPIPLSGRDGVERPFRVLGQYKASLILVEGPDALYVIDQHVAHERVLFERLLQTIDGDAIQGQRLLEPLMLEMTADESEALADAQQVLGDAGFEYEVLSGGTVAVSTTPATLSTNQAAEFLLEVARSGVPTEQLAKRFRELLAAGLSCRAAVKLHDVLGLREIEDLLSDLFACDNPYACPHGRPVMLRLSDFELEKSFHRR